MKQFAKSLFYCVIALAPLSLWAGVRIQMEETDLKSNKATRQEMMIDATRLRVNTDANTSVLFLTDGGRNRMVMLDKARNTYQEIDQQTMNQMGQQMQSAMSMMQEQMKNMPAEQRAMMEKMMQGKMGGGGAPPVATTYTSTGSATVNGFACTKYEGKRGAEKVSEMCAAQAAAMKMTPGDYQVFEKMKEFMSGFQSAMQNSPFAGRIGSYGEKGVEGFPVQSLSFTNGQPVHRVDLKSIEQASFSDADFSLGSAKKTDMPMGPGGRGR